MGGVYIGLAFGGSNAGRCLTAPQLAAEIAGQLRGERVGYPRPAGRRMPPVAALARRLGVADDTVRAAYDELAAQQLIERGPHDEFLVVVAPAGAASVAPATARVEPLALKPAPALSSAAPRPGALLQLGSVFIDPRLLRNEALAACFHRVLDRDGLADFADPQGFAPLRRAIATRLRSRGIDADPEHIVTTVGSQQVLELVSRSLCRATIATENPAYHLAKLLFERNGIDVLGLPIEPFANTGLDAWEKPLRERQPALLYLTTRFQNPTGHSYTSADIARILEWSGEHGFGILEDDWASEMLSGTEFTPSLRALAGNNVLYMNSFTKKLLPSLRVGYVLANANTVATLIAAKRISIGSAPALGEAVLCEFLEHGHYDAHALAVQAELDRRYRCCLELLRHHMPEEVRWTTPGGGPALWVECPTRVSLPALSARALERQLLLPLSDSAFFGVPHLHGFKLGYASLTPDELERGIEGLAAELKRELGPG